jgi:hypothetical protein
MTMRDKLSATGPLLSIEAHGPGMARIIDPFEVSCGPTNGLSATYADVVFRHIRCRWPAARRYAARVLANHDAARRLASVL